MSVTHNINGVSHRTEASIQLKLKTVSEINALSFNSLRMRVDANTFLRFLKMSIVKIKAHWRSIEIGHKQIAQKLKIYIGDLERKTYTD